MKTLKYEVGMLVDHPNRPQWGPGKIVHVEGEKIHVYFRDAMERTARRIAFGVVPLPLAESQTDPMLDLLPKPNMEAGSCVLPGTYKHAAFGDQPAASKKKTKKAAAAGGAA